jgi:molecular chaperone Hsp33
MSSDPDSHKTPVDSKTQSMAPDGPLPDWFMEVKQQDSVIPFAVEALDVRGRMVRLGPALDTILARHNYPEPVARLLGEAAALTVLLGSALKFEGKFILQTQSDGPVNMLVVDFATPDALRATARFDEAGLQEAIRLGKTRPEDLLGKGHLAMTIDQGKHTSRYQGVVALDGSSLEAIAHAYFAQSEQIPTLVRLAIGQVQQRDEDEGKPHWRAGGIMLQFMPEAKERIIPQDIAPGDHPDGMEARHKPSVDDAWVEAESLAATVEDDELIDPDLTPDRVLFRLFHERGVHIFEPQSVADKCNCTTERLLSILSQFEEEERKDMVKDGKIHVTCEFCSKTYDFNPEEVL